MNLPYLPATANLTVDIPDRRQHSLPPLYCLQVLHASEIQELQIRVEEGGEKIKTLRALSHSVRGELDHSRESRHTLEVELVAACVVLLFSFFLLFLVS